MKKHAKLSPSAASRWLRCTASANVEAKYANTTTEYAEEGTVAHKVAELKAKHAVRGITKIAYDRKILELSSSKYLNHEMLDACEDYAAYIKETYHRLKKKCPDAFVELEVMLDLTSIIPEGFGTADCVIIAEPEMWVIDFKYGKGVQVSAEGNEQMELYALGAIEKYRSLYDIKKVGMAIVQPRLGGISEFEVDAGALRVWGATHIKPLAKEAYEGPGAFKPSAEACRFCKAKQDCKARAEHFLKLVEGNPADELLTAEEAGQILQKADGIEAWLKDIEAKVTAALFDGKLVSGWKLVRGRSNRKFSDENAAAAILKDETELTHSEIYKTKVISVSEAEKLLGKKKTSELLGYLIVKPEGKPTLAKSDDKREEYNPKNAILNAFDE